MPAKKVAELSADKLRESIENYTTTVHALLCFTSVATWEQNAQKKGSFYSLGRSMTTSNKNKMDPSVDITPDLVIQISEDEGYVCEAKKTLSQHNNDYQTTLKQIQTYDDNLLGWWTTNETIKRSNAILLIEISRAADFKEFVLQQQSEKGALFSGDFAFIEFNRAPEVNDFIFFRTSLGKINNDDLGKRLRSGIKVPTEKVFESYKSLKFYDSPPETEHLMVILWNDIFTDLKTSTKYDEKKKAWPIKVNSIQLTEELQKLYGNQSQGKRDVSFPNISWVRQALDNFVLIDLAQHLQDEEYLILYKNIRKDILDKFVTWRKKSKTSKSEKQTELFASKG